MCSHVALNSCKDQGQLTYRMSLIVDFSDCFLMVSFSLFVPSLVLPYKLKARSKHLISFSLNIFGKNTGVFATYFMLCHVRRHVLNVMFFPPIVLLHLVEMVTASSFRCKSTLSSFVVSKLLRG